ncbi:hypothetical protein [Ancylobacter sp. SL191]|uniref:hypothetical protein n=1 Tax=Ancylobacter sp. SL191 TaxID=2995166 RepID=UPI00226FDE07|nr:hypothetical protein [Ancylobacter sp. SL191]WAC29239.1 hypothetical protein OU996_09525 [Ancylobacter sp. SL191]
MSASLSTAAAALQTAILSTKRQHLDGISRDLWRLYAGQRLSDDEATTLDALIRSRRSCSGGEREAGVADDCAAKQVKVALRFRPRRVQRSPDKEASLRRRRELSRSSPMPRHLASRFTEGQCAALAVIGGEVKGRGVCDLPLDKIAALAGVCRTTVRNAINEARRLGLVRVTSRPRPGQKNLTNLIEILSPEWRAWLKRGPTAHRPTGCKTVSATTNLRPTMSIEIRKEAFEEAGGGRPPGFSGSRPSGKGGRHGVSVPQ